MIQRYGKVGLVASVAFFLFLVVLNNLTDYRSNYLFVENVLNMSTTFEGNQLMWRRIESPLIHHLFYWGIIAWEAAAMVLCGWGSWLLWKNREAPAGTFQQAKQWAVAGLILSLLQWFVAFITVGGEWFLMWQSPTWNGQDAAHRMFVILGIILIFLVMRDEELENQAK